MVERFVDSALKEVLPSAKIIVSEVPSTLVANVCSACQQMKNKTSDMYSHERKAK